MILFNWTHRHWCSWSGCALQDARQLLNPLSGMVGRVREICCDMHASPFSYIQVEQAARPCVQILVFVRCHQASSTHTIHQSLVSYVCEISAQTVLLKC